MKRKQNTKSVKFIVLTQQILNNRHHANIIRWSKDGKKLEILDKIALQQQILPKYFKHGNYSSFLRQLNMYGFTSAKDNEGTLYYENPYFTQTKIIMKKIQKKRNHTNDENKQEGFLFLTDFNDFKRNIVLLQSEQSKIQQQLLSSIRCQYQIQMSIKSILETKLQLAQQGQKNIKFFIQGLKILVQAMKPEYQNSFQSFIKSAYPYVDETEITSTIDVIDKEESQFLFSPTPFGVDIVNSYQDLSELSDLGFFGFEL